MSEPEDAPLVLIVLAAGAEEIETITVADLLVRGGCRVAIAGLAGMAAVAGSRGIPLAPQVAFDAVREADCAAVYLPGGVGCARACEEDPRVQRLIRDRLARRAWLAVICASPGALVPQGLCAGRRLTSFPAVRERLRAAGAQWVDAPVVIDDRLITSQSAGTAMAMGLTLIGCLRSPQAAEAVAAQIIAPGCVRAVPPPP